MSEQKTAFDAWLSRHCDYDDLSKSEIELAYEAWQAALASPEVQALQESLQAIIYDMEVEGNGTGYEYQNAKAVLAAMEKQE